MGYEWRIANAVCHLCRMLKDERVKQDGQINSIFDVGKKVAHKLG